MTTERDPRTRIVLSWLREDAHENAERVLLRALDEVDTTPQRRSWWPAWRTDRMNTFAKLIAAAAAVLVVGDRRLPVSLREDPGPAAPTQATLTAPPFGLAGNGVIALAKDGDIFVADRPGGDLRPLVAGPEDDRSPMFSPDGTRLAFLSRYRTRVVPDGRRCRRHERRPDPAGTLGACEWSFAPDGRSLMAVAEIDGEKRVVVRPVDPAAALTVLDIQLRDGSHGAPHGGSPASARRTPRRSSSWRSWIRTVRAGSTCTTLRRAAIRTIVEPADDQYVHDVAWLPDGEHIIYSMTLAPGPASSRRTDQVTKPSTPCVAEFSPLSNDGTRIVAERDVAARRTLIPVTTPSGQVVVPIDGDGEPVELACGPGTDIECAWSWIWSPDDSMLIGTVHHEANRTTYLQADPDTGQVTELDWDGLDLGTSAWQSGTSAWQRLAP